MSFSLTIDPITRISGPLKINVIIGNNTVIDAQVSGTLYRGFEKMLKGRSPLDAVYYTERICGICSAAHSVASTLALENAFKVTPNNNGTNLRNIIHGCEFLQNHIRHFYLYAIPDYVKLKIQLMDPPIYIDYRLPEKYNESISKNYVEAVKFSRLAHEALALLGGKAPHNHGVLPGGVSGSLDIHKFIKLKSLITSIYKFIKNQMFEDCFIISEYYKDYFDLGVGCKNLMTFGFPDYVEPSIYIDNHKESLNPSNITENIYSSWYYSDTKINKPLEGVFSENLDKESAYSFIKAPRYNNLPMQVGPLARMILSGNYEYHLSAMDRIKARVIEASKIAEIILKDVENLNLNEPNIINYQELKECIGSGLIDTTRGSLGHWVKISESKIENYDIITPSAWNLSPKDESTYGPVEQALIGTKIQNSDAPIELGRIVRSFDPCISCAVHCLNNNEDLILNLI